MQISARVLIICLGVILVGIIVSSLVPRSPMVFDRATDAILFHLIVYGAVAFVGCLIARKWLPFWWSLSVVLTAVVALGILVELAQTQVPIRSLEMVDIYANIIGGLLGVVFSIIVIKT